MRFQNSASKVLFFLTLSFLVNPAAYADPSPDPLAPAPVENPVIEPIDPVPAPAPVPAPEPVPVPAPVPEKPPVGSAPETAPETKPPVGAPKLPTPPSAPPKPSSVPSAPGSNVPSPGASAQPTTPTQPGDASPGPSGPPVVLGPRRSAPLVLDGRNTLIGSSKEGDLAHFEISDTSGIAPQKLEELTALTEVVNKAVDQYNTASQSLSLKSESLKKSKAEILVKKEKILLQRKILLNYVRNNYMQGGVSSTSYMHLLTSDEPFDLLHVMMLGEKIGVGQSNNLLELQKSEADLKDSVSKVEREVKAEKENVKLVADNLSTVRARLLETETFLTESKISTSVSLSESVLDPLLPKGATTRIKTSKSLDIYAFDLSEKDSAAIKKNNPEALGAKVLSLEVNGRVYKVLGANPSLLRSFAPSKLQQSDALWQSMQRKELVFTHESAEKANVTLNQQIGVPKTQKNIKVGAVATFNWQGLDIITSEEAVIELSKLTNKPLANSVLVPNSKNPAAFLKLKELVPGASLLAMHDFSPLATDFFPESVAQQKFGSFTYRPRSDESIEVDPVWVRNNIVTTNLPILGNMNCNRLIVPQLFGALSEIKATGLEKYIHPGEYGGCFVPRNIANSNSMSLHTWGAAFDINVPGNQRGVKGDLNPEVVKIFKRWGFRWGGDWGYTDPMHFEIGALLKQ